MAAATSRVLSRTPWRAASPQQPCGRWRYWCRWKRTLMVEPKGLGDIDLFGCEVVEEGSGES